MSENTRRKMERLIEVIIHRAKESGGDPRLMEITRQEALAIINGADEDSENTP